MECGHEAVFEDGCTTRDDNVSRGFGIRRAKAAPEGLGNRYQALGFAFNPISTSRRMASGRSIAGSVWPAIHLSICLSCAGLKTVEERAANR
jgi:hypothetical protein